MADLSLVLAPQTAADQAVIDKLDERVFGPGRFARSAYRLREGVPADLRLSYVARVGTYLVGANRMNSHPLRRGAAPAARSFERRAGVPLLRHRRGAGGEIPGRGARGRPQARHSRRRPRLLSADGFSGGARGIADFSRPCRSGAPALLPADRGRFGRDQWARAQSAPHLTTASGTRPDDNCRNRRPGHVFVLRIETSALKRQEDR